MISNLDNHHELIYASSPFTLIHRLSKELSISSNETFLDLGSGFGHICHDIHLLTGVSTIGVDCVQERLLFAKQLTTTLNLKSKCTFIEENFLTAKIPPADYIYITCTCFSDQTMKKLITQLKTTRSNTQIITVTKSLPKHSFELLKSFNATFDWGHDIIFIYRKR